MHYEPNISDKSHSVVAMDNAKCLGNLKFLAFIFLFKFFAIFLFVFLLSGLTLLIVFPWLFLVVLVLFSLASWNVKQKRIKYIQPML